MHPRLLHLMFWLFSSVFVSAQTHYKPDKFSSFTIALPLAENVALKSFSSITVVDWRYDTAKLGFGLDGTKHKMVQVESGVAAAVQRYLNHGVQSQGTAPKLLLVIRNLWVQQLKSGELKEVDPEFEKENISQCIAKFDIYVKNDDVCQALIRIDTLIEDRRYLKFSGPEMLAIILNRTVEKIAEMDIEQATSKKTKMKYDELMKLYDQRMANPRILNDQLQRGIYLTFADFLQNRAKPYDFVLEQDEGGDYLYLNENGQQRLFTDFWGFCDGKFNFVKIGGNFFTLVRDHKSYSFLGCLQPIHRSAPRSRNRVGRYALWGVFGELHQTRLVKFLRPMQLDMETGKPL